MGQSGSHNDAAASSADRRAVGMTPRALTGLARSAELRRGESRALASGFVFLLVLLIVTAANAGCGIGGKSGDAFVRNWLSSAVYIVVAAIVAFRAIRVAARRRSWAVFA